MHPNCPLSIKAVQKSYINNKEIELQGASFVGSLTLAPDTGLLKSLLFLGDRSVFVRMR